SARVECGYRRDQLQPGAHCPLGVILVGLGVAKIDEHTVAKGALPDQCAHGRLCGRVPWRAASMRFMPLAWQPGKAQESFSGISLGRAFFLIFSRSSRCARSLWQPCLTQAFTNALKFSEEHSVIGPPLAVLQPASNGIVGPHAPKLRYGRLGFALPPSPCVTCSNVSVCDPEGLHRNRLATPLNGWIKLAEMRVCVADVEIPNVEERITRAELNCHLQRCERFCGVAYADLCRSERAVGWR